jgi:putative sterol carrier protein
VLDVLNDICVKVNERIATDERMREMAASKDRTIVLEFTDEGTYTIEILQGKVLPPKKGGVEKPTLKVRTDVQTMTKIIEKKMSPLYAYALKKIKVEGPLDEVMLLKDFF